jgi:hypothetical protein
VSKARTKPRNRIGRDAIELLKDYYANGDGRFDGIASMVAWFRSEHRIKVTIDQVRGWDRQARLERADQLQATTFPSARIGYARQAAPTHGERALGRSTRLQDTLTRITNDEREAKADAEQADASSIERARALMMTSVRSGYQALAILNDES